MQQITNEQLEINRALFEDSLLDEAQHPQNDSSDSENL